MALIIGLVAFAIAYIAFTISRMYKKSQPKERTDMDMNEEEKKETTQETSEGTRFLGMAGITILLAILILLAAFCTYKINPGYAGVLYNMDGGIEDKVLDQGFHVVAPWKKVVEYHVSTETVYYAKSEDGGANDRSINVSTKDGKQVNVSVTYAYHMHPNKLPEVFTKFRGQPTEVIEAGYVKNELYRAINEVTSQYNLMDLVGDKRPEINGKIFAKFRDSLADFGIVIETINLSDVVPDEQTKQAIQKVVDAQNKLEQAKIEKQTAEIEAERARIVAKGKADAAKIEAEGIAEANKKIGGTLTDTIVRQNTVEKWDGKLPQYQAGQSGQALFEIK